MDNQFNKIGINPLETGWDKNDLPERRRSLLLKYYGSYEVAARVMREFAETSSNGVRNIAAEDATYCYKMYLRQLENKKVPSYAPVLWFMGLLLVSGILSSGGILT